MTVVLGREAGVNAGPVADLGSYRARDGTSGAPVALDLDGPHATLLVGKRGYGKSYTLGVLVEELARTTGLTPVLVDPVGVFHTLGEPVAGEPIPATVVEDPTVSPTSLDPPTWCDLVGLSPESGAGGLVWRAGANASTLAGMCAHVRDSNAPSADRRAAINHLRLAETWGVFDPRGLTESDLARSGVTVLDVSGLDPEPMNAVVRTVATAIYEARLAERIDRLPWLLIDEAHAFFSGIAAPAIERILRRGRAPGVSLVAATQQPATISRAGITQSDLLLSHRLTAASDIEALRNVQPTYLEGSLTERLPENPGEVVVVDDTTESVHTVRIRRRVTPHGGTNPRVSERVTTDD